MRYEINHGSAFGTLDAVLAENESLIAQPNSMVTMTTGIEISARMGAHLKGAGWGKGVRSMLTGESFFTAVFTAKKEGERISLAPEAIGEIVPITLDGSNCFYVSSGGFLACTDGVTIETEFAGLKGWLAQKGLFLMKASGRGELFLQSVGAVVQQSLAEGERLVVDNRYVVAFGDTVRFEVVKAAASIKDAVLSGEGLVNRYTGPGRLLVQTRSKPKLGGWVRAFAEAAT